MPGHNLSFSSSFQLFEFFFLVRRRHFVKTHKTRFLTRVLMILLRLRWLDCQIWQLQPAKQLIWNIYCLYHHQWRLLITSLKFVKVSHTFFEVMQFLWRVLYTRHAPAVPRNFIVAQVLPP
jgi:hypothetical protein